MGLGLGGPVKSFLRTVFIAAIVINWVFRFPIVPGYIVLRSVGEGRYHVIGSALFPVLREGCRYALSLLFSV
jgi:hypothetical protein